MAYESGIEDTMTSSVRKGPESESEVSAREVFFLRIRKTTLLHKIEWRATCMLRVFK